MSKVVTWNSWSHSPSMGVQAEVPQWPLPSQRLSCSFNTLSIFSVLGISHASHCSFLFMFALYEITMPITTFSFVISLKQLLVNHYQPPLMVSPILHDFRTLLDTDVHLHYSSHLIAIHVSQGCWACCQVPVLFMFRWVSVTLKLVQMTVLMPHNIFQLCWGPVNYNLFDAGVLNLGGKHLKCRTPTLRTDFGHPWCTLCLPEF